MIMKTLAAVFIVTFLTFGTVAAQKISQWREDNRTGVSAEKGLLRMWPQNGPSLLWSISKLPRGYSSVTFGDNRIFLTGMDGQNDVLVALDTTGNLKWQTPFGRVWSKASPESRCTPTVEGNRVYVSSGFGDLACIDASSGKIIWSLKASEIYKGTYGEWGIAESLLIDGQKLYFSPGGPETMTIALDKTNGKLIWKSPSINDAPAYVSPILVERGGKKLIINISLHYLYAVDASGGAIVWKVDHTKAIDDKASVAVWPDAPLIKCVTPLYKDGKIYMTGGYNHGGALFELSNDGKTAKIVWTDSVLDVHHGGVVLVNSCIYGANWLSNNDGNWCCIDWNTGRKMYEEHWKCKGSVIAADGMLYIYDEKSGFAGLVKPNPSKFELVSSFRVTQGTGPYWSHPVINHGKLYLRHGDYLAAYSIKAK